VDATLEAIEQSLRDGEPVRLTGFGRFDVARYTGRPGVNPRTGERIDVPTTTVARFTPGLRLRRAVR
jgi:DNA-binding protein HU-beta